MGKTEQKIGRAKGTNRDKADPGGQLLRASQKLFVNQQNNLLMNIVP